MGQIASVYLAKGHKTTTGSYCMLNLGQINLEVSTGSTHSHRACTYIHTYVAHTDMHLHTTYYGLLSGYQPVKKITVITMGQIASVYLTIGHKKNTESYCMLNLGEINLEVSTGGTHSHGARTYIHTYVVHTYMHMHTMCSLEGANTNLIST